MIESDITKVNTGNSHEVVAIIASSQNCQEEDSGEKEKSIEKKINNNTEPFDPLFFQNLCQTVEPTDSNIRLYLETTWNLLEEAGYTRESLKNDCGSSVEVFIGLESNLTTNITTTTLSANQPSCEEIADSIFRYFDLYRPSLNHNSTKLPAQDTLDLACQRLLTGNCKLAIVGGITLSSDTELNPWIILLKRLSQAIADTDNILAVIKYSPDHSHTNPKHKLLLEQYHPQDEPDYSVQHTTDKSNTLAQQHLPEIIVLSANTPSALHVVVSRLLNQINKTAHETKPPLADVAYTLQSCREALNYRLAMVVSDIKDLMLGLAQYLVSEGCATTGESNLLNHTTLNYTTTSTVPISIHRGEINTKTQAMSLLSGSSGAAMMNALLLEGNLENLELPETATNN